MDFPIIPLALSLALAAHGYRRGSLSKSGCIGAFAVGFVTLSVPLRIFGVGVLTLYFVGSRATKVGKKTKGNLEEGYHEAGNRSAWQVVCNTFAALTTAVLWGASFADSYILSGLVPLPTSLGQLQARYSPDSWCPIALGQDSGWSRYLLFLSLGHFACCLGDTLASELGILSTTPPVLITTFKRVPPGTNGGISPLGTFASLLGGVIMGVSYSVVLIIQSSQCRTELTTVLVDMIGWGAFAGLAGSLIDSVLGATLQRTSYSTTTKRVLQDDTKVTEDVKVISGLKILTNNQVNLLASLLTGLFIANLV